MKLIVGLGNPGKNYINSRHNIGFRVIEELRKKYGLFLKKEKYLSCLSAKSSIAGAPLLLAMPLTFMNLSGSAVAGLLAKYRVALADLLVICDDIDLAFGRIKVRCLGSSGGHNGLKSIIDNLGSDKFARLRIGIGRPASLKTDMAEYVLGAFSRKEKVQLKEILPQACLCCESWAKQGIAKSMNLFNRRSKE